MKRYFTPLKKIHELIRKSGIALIVSLLFVGQAKAQTIYGTTTANELVSFNATSPSVILSTSTITGITPGQTIEGLDFRPNTGQLYAFGYDATTTTYQLYTINLSTGVAVSINMPTTIALGSGPIGFDFNPTVDRIRVVSANGGNFRLHPVTGAIAFTDGSLAYATGDPNQGMIPNIVVAAYDNSYIGSAVTELYNYDNSLNVLTEQNPPNLGTLVTVGASGITTSTFTPRISMDIFFDNTLSVNKGYLLANTQLAPGIDNFYSVDLTTGAATLIGVIGSTNTLTNIAAFIDRTAPTLLGQLAYALSGVKLISFDTQNPEFIRSLSSITGVTANQAIVGMDFRPFDNMLYILGYDSTTSGSQLYTVNTTNGVATAVNVTPTTLSLGSSSIGLDFNPVVDKIRLVSNNESNLRMDPNTGLLFATDLSLNYAATDFNFGANPSAGTAAYTNSFSGTTTTTLYNYDEVLNIITTQSPPNNGVLNTVGSSAIMVNATDPSVDLDIFYNSGSMTNTAYLTANTGAGVNDSLYTVNLSSGTTSAVGQIGFGIPVKDIAIQTVSISTGIAKNNFENNAIKVYPSILGEEATILIPTGMEGTINIFDVTGRKIQVINRSVNETSIKWNTSELTKGIYFVNVSGSTGVHHTVKVIK